MNKKLVLVVFVLLAACFFPLVNAYTPLGNAILWGGTTESTYLFVDDLYSGGIAGVFYSDYAGYMDRIQIDLHRHGSPNFNIEVALLDGSGWNTTGLNMTDVLAVSNGTLQASTISTASGGTAYFFNFTHNSANYLQLNVPYAICIYAVDFVSGDGSNNVAMFYSADDDDPNEVTGVALADGDANWSVAVGFSGGIPSVYDGDAPPTPTPSPSPSPVPAVTGNVVPSDPFVDVPSYYMILLVLFAVVAVLAGLYVTFERESENKGVALLFVLVGLVIFVVMIVGFFVA